jgi:hypothetical protein
MAKTKPFDAPSFAVQVPDEWIDLSSYIIGGPVIEGFRTSIVIARNIFVKEPTLDAYVDRQIEDLQKLPEFVMTGRRAAKLGDLPAIWLDYEWTQSKDKQIHQRQCYLRVRKQVYTLTTSAPAGHFDRVAGVYAEVVNTFRPKLWDVV